MKQIDISSPKNVFFCVYENQTLLPGYFVFKRFLRKGTLALSFLTFFIFSRVCDHFKNCSRKHTFIFVSSFLLHFLCFLASNSNRNFLTFIQVTPNHLIKNPEHTIYFLKMRRLSSSFLKNVRF